MKDCTKVIKKLKQGITNIEIKIEDEVRKYWSEYNSIWHLLGTRLCEKSPVGLCIYNKFDDPASDSCIFCEEPHDRK